MTDTPKTTEKKSSVKADVEALGEQVGALKQQVEALQERVGVLEKASASRCYSNSWGAAIVAIVLFALLVVGGYYAYDFLSPYDGPPPAVTQSQG